MKIKKNEIGQLVNFAISLAILIGLSNCGGTTDPLPDPSLAELQAEIVRKISGTPFTATSVLRNDTDVTADFPALIVYFDDGIYSAQNGKQVWPSSGTWSFVQGKTDQMLRDNEIVMDMVVETDKLTLSFLLDENVFSIGGRIQTVSSSYVFVLNK